MEIYNEPTLEWSKSVGGRYPKLASMCLFDAFDVPWNITSDVKAACRAAEKLTGRQFSVLAKESDENGRPTIVQVKRIK